MKSRKLYAVLVLSLIVGIIVGCRSGETDVVNENPTDAPIVDNTDNNPYTSDITEEPKITVAVTSNDKNKEDKPNTSLDDLRDKYLTPKVTATPVPTPTKVPKVIDLLEVSGVNYPGTLYYGSAFGLKGVINFIDSSLDTLTGRILDKDGKVVMEVKEDLTTIKQGTYDISKGDINYKLVFNKLAVGDYVYKLTISGKNVKEHVILEKEFKVVKKSTNKSTPTPAPTITKVPEPTKSAVANSGNASMVYEGKDIDVKVTIGGSKLTGVNNRDAVLIGNKAKEILPNELIKISEEGWKWVVVHVEVAVSSKYGTGCYNDCVPDIFVRASNGTKLNSTDIQYYILNLDANGKNYSNTSTYTKNYDIAFQVPYGISKFNMTFGSGTNQYTYKHQ